MQPWQAQKLAQMRRDDAANRGLVPGRAGSGSIRSGSRRASLRFRVGTALVAIGERLTLPECDASEPAPRPRLLGH
jgi:hypothetical protein